MSTKRRLQLLPEVLPKPERGPQTPSSVRARTLARLSVLAAITAAACGGKGDGGYGVVDPLPSPTGGTGGAGGTGGGGSAGSPYGVVDPLPSPATNCELPAVLSASAIYVSDPQVDAGAGELADAGAPARDAGVDGGRGSLRHVRLTLVLSAQATRGPVLPATSNVTFLPELDGDGNTFDFLVQGDEAEMEILLSCVGGGAAWLRAVLQLGESSILVTVENFQDR